MRSIIVLNMSYTQKTPHDTDAKHVSLNVRKKQNDMDSFVLEKAIFSNIFEKDIQRVYLYKKAERLAKAVSLIAPGLAAVPDLARRVEKLSLALVDASLEVPAISRDLLAKELLALSSLVGVARVRGLLSHMNTEIIAGEAKNLLDEIAAYEPPHITLPEAPTIPALSRKVAMLPHDSQKSVSVSRVQAATHKGQVSDKGHIKDTVKKESRASAIIAVLKEKGATDIKGISTIVRGVSEKTIQRELTQLVADGKVVRSGSRRWTAYSLA